MPNVAFKVGLVRYDNINNALNLLKKDFADKVSAAKRIVLVPDLLCINGKTLYGSTNVDAVRAILDVIDTFTNKRITIASGSFNDENLFHQFDYHDLLPNYSARFVDLTNDDTTEVKVGKKTIGISNIILESDFRISAAVLKRDTKTSLLGSIPNIIINAIADEDKATVYSGVSIQSIILELTPLVRPHLSVLDGFDTPRSEAVKSCAIASTDAVAADSVAAKLLKLKPRYLKTTPNKILGNKISDAM